MSGLLMPDGSPATSSTPPAPSYDDLTPEQQAEVDAMAGGEEPDLMPVATVFAIVVERDGTVSLSSDLNIPVAPDREATPTDILGAMSVVKHDVESTLTAVKVQQGFMAMQQQMAEHLEAQRVAKSLRL